MSKSYDIVAVTGKYVNKDGEEKSRYLNVGAVIKGDNGPYIMLNKWFNPAGLAEPGRESILLSLFEPKPRDGQAPKQEPPKTVPIDTQDIPF